jgi:hypothetical protein
VRWEVRPLDSEVLAVDCQPLGRIVSIVLSEQAAGAELLIQYQFYSDQTGSLPRFRGGQV